MTKDRYYDDHEIEVVGGSNTIIVKDNVLAENLTANVRVTTNTIAPVSGGIVTVSSDLTVGDDLIVNDDATIVGTLDVGSTIAATRYRGDASPFSAKLFHVVFVIDTATPFPGIDLSSFGFTSNTFVYGLTGTIELNSNPDSNYNGAGPSGGVDYSFSLEYRKSTTSVIVWLNGADFPAGLATIRATIWYS